jgi:hypothetical protein
MVVKRTVIAQACFTTANRGNTNLIALVCLSTNIRECSLFIPGVGTEEKLIAKRKKQPPTFSVNHFFPYPTIA